MASQLMCLLTFVSFVFVTLFAVCTMHYCEALKLLTVKELICVIGRERLTSAEKRNRDRLLSAIENSVLFQEAVMDEYNKKKVHQEDYRDERVKWCKIESRFESEEVDERFFQDVGEDTRDQVLSRFLDRTGNEALLQVVCIVCAGEFFKTEAKECNLRNLEHKHLLVPSHPHPQHRLTLDMLLHEAAVYSRDGQLYGYICNDCLMEMTKVKLPAGALANNMWIGDVPIELAILSLPERILISRYFPAAYIVKLHPRSRGHVSSGAPSFNSGLRGNVSTYQLNTSDISSMIQGDRLPHHPAVLSATIGISIVGPNNVREKSLLKFLNVSQRRVCQALRFLKNNNPFYEHIQISDDNLSLLLDDGVPLELSNVVREMNNNGVLDQE